MTTAGSEIAIPTASDSTRAVRDTARGSRNQTRPGFAAIGQLFRAAAKAVMRRDDDKPEPRQRRRGSGETRQAYGLAARSIISRARLPAAAYATASFLSDTLDWLNLWHNDAGEGSEPDGGLDRHSNHLSPGL
jgi:hypothetical protein